MADYRYLLFGKGTFTDANSVTFSVSFLFESIIIV